MKVGENEVTVGENLAAAFALQTRAHPPVPARLAGAEAEAGLLRNLVSRFLAAQHFLYRGGEEHT